MLHACTADIAREHIFHFSPKYGSLFDCSLFAAIEGFLLSALAKGREGGEMRVQKGVYHYDYLEAIILNFLCTFVLLCWSIVL